MKLLAVLGAGLIAVSGVAAAAPAEAAPHDRWGRGPGWDRGPGWRGPRGPRYAYGYGRPRVTCRWVRTWNGPQRQCFNTYR